MKSYLTYLYEMELHENVLDFLELHETRLEHECEIYYKKGFRYAMRLMLECFNEKF